MQARVFELVFTDGTPTGRVVKIAHTDTKHAMINAIWISMEREWEIGTQLRAALQEPTSRLPGFMSVEDCLVQFVDTKGKRARFGGMILEKLNGWEVYKRVDTPTFHNIHYVREMLFQVFQALDRAQQKLGFDHADLGMRNIMEHYPLTWEDVQQRKEKEGDSNVGQQQKQQQQCAVCGPNDPFATTPSSQQPQPSTKSACAPVAPRIGWSTTDDGSKIPLGPNIEFKIIDYGVARFDEVLAQTAGGFQSRETYAKLKRMFAGSHVTFASPGKKGAQIKMETSGGEPLGKKQRYLLPTGLRNRFRIRSIGDTGTTSGLDRPSNGPPTPTSGPSTPSSILHEEMSGDFPIRLQSMGYMNETARSQMMSGLQSIRDDYVGGNGNGGADTNNNNTNGQVEGMNTWATGTGVGGRVSVETCPNESEDPTVPQTTIGAGLVERMYRSFWNRKGDVFHLLLNMAIVLDNRVWPCRDRNDVLLFVSLVHHVTGLKMKAHFTNENNPKTKCYLGRYSRIDRGQLNKAEEMQHKHLQKLMGLRKSWRTWFRRMHMRWRGHMKPFNSGLTAAEALVAPFFKMHSRLADVDGEPQVVDVFGYRDGFAEIKSVCVETAFPRCAAMGRGAPPGRNNMVF
jgi:hypothetical protein